MSREWSEVPGIRIVLGDCLDVMPMLEAGSVDLVLSDLPYGTTACKWDTVIPFEPLWACFKRVLKPKGAVVLTASQPFTSQLVMSNPKWFRYCLVWAKTNVTGFLDANRKPLKSHEDVLVFGEAVGTYNPQKVKAPRRTQKHRGGRAVHYGAHGRSDYDNNGEAYPRSVIMFGQDRGSGHPTQKPVALFEYLIRTYSNEGETVLDATVGSGTTAIAALNAGRRCIGIEREAEYFDDACRRVADAAAKTPLFV